MNTPHSFTVPGELLRRTSTGRYMLVSPWVGWSYRCHQCGTGLFLPTKPHPLFPIPACTCGTDLTSWFPVAGYVAPVTPPEQHVRLRLDPLSAVPVPITWALFLMDEENDAMEGTSNVPPEYDLWSQNSESISC